MQLKMTPTPELRQVDTRNCVLIVDDEQPIRDLCATILKDYRTLKASNGDEALRIIEKEQVDVILTDVMMPIMNGLDLLKAVKEKEPTKIVVIMTGYTERDIVLHALKADADDFISKPINMLQLRTTVQKVLEKKQLKEELVHLKRMDRLKGDFLGLVSHKLKTPITAISLFIQNLARGIGDPSDPSFQNTLSLILEESQYLGSLIHDLLYYSEAILQEDPPKLTTINPALLTQEVVMEIRDSSAKKAVTLEDQVAEDLPYMALDPQRIRFALRAMLDNAVKFTPPGGTVTFSSVIGPNTLQFIVRDTGPGISPTDMPKIFEKFYQVDPDNTGQVRGFGLGLYYSRQFAQSHGGTINLESSSSGTIATLELPLALED